MALQLTKSYNLNCEYIKPINIEDNTFFSAQRAKCLFVSNRKLKTLLNKKSIEMTL